MSQLRIGSRVPACPPRGADERRAGTPLRDLRSANAHPYYVDEHVTLHHGDCLDVLRTLPDCSIDAVVTDPPYGLRFMGRAWDGQDIIDRGAKIENVALKSEDLFAESLKFQTQAHDLRLRQLWRKYGTYGAVFLSAVFVLVLRFYFFV